LNGSREARGDEGACSSSGGEVGFLTEVHLPLFLSLFSNNRYQATLASACPLTVFVLGRKVADSPGIFIALRTMQLHFFSVICSFTLDRHVFINVLTRPPSLAERRCLQVGDHCATRCIWPNC
jgi:hypothetical protein